MEQAVPLQGDWLNFNRLTLRAERTVPIGPVKCARAPILQPCPATTCDAAPPTPNRAAAGCGCAARGA